MTTPAYPGQATQLPADQRPRATPAGGEPKAGEEEEVIYTSDPEVAPYAETSYVPAPTQQQKAKDKG